MKTRLNSRLGRANRLGRIAAALVAMAATALLATACNKPTEEACKKAIENIRSLYGTDANDVGAPPAAVLRSCQGGETPKSVACFTEAKSLDDLGKCEGGAFAKLFAKDKESEGEQPEDKDSDK